MDKFYVYGYFDPRIPYQDDFLGLRMTNQPFYIGKGKGIRRNQFCIDRIQQIERDGNKLIINLLKDQLTSAEALYIEAILINRYSNILENNRKPSIKKWQD